MTSAASTPRSRSFNNTGNSHHPSSSTNNTNSGNHAISMLTINTSPRGVKTPMSNNSSPYSFSLTSPLTSPRGTRSHKNNPKPISSTLLWILTVVAIGLLNVIYQWASPEGEFGSLLTGSSTTTTTTLKKSDHVVVEFPFDKPKPQSTAVFYHIYFPPTPQGRDNSARIIQEQLEQLQASQQSLTIYYNTIGTETFQLNSTHVQKYCRNHLQTCHFMQHYPEGMEDLTLQRLHDFCTLESKHDTTSIAYLHNKGSFSTKPLNEAWRYQMTQAVVSSQCQSATTSTTSKESSCNLCGLWFSAERGMFMAGNMWRSNCSYLRQLISPHKFQAAMHEVTAEAMMERLRYKLLMTMQEIRAGVFGIDRYATEFWVASHPTVQPCDFSQAVSTLPPGKSDITDHFLGWLRKMGEDYEGELQAEWFVPQAPHHALPLPNHLQVSQFPDVRQREYFLLAGNLFRWYYLYQQAPAPDSWVYQWFPDGEIWREAVQTHGQNAVSVVTSKALKEEVASGRNRYTADHSKKLTSTTAAKKKPTKASADTTAAKKGTTTKKGGSSAKAGSGTAKHKQSSSGLKGAKKGG